MPLDGAPLDEARLGIGEDLEMIPRSEGLEILRMSSGIKVSTLPYRTLPYRTLSLTALDPNPRPDLTLTQTVVTSAISRSASAGGGALLARILRASYTPKPNPTQVELQDLTKGELLSYPLDAIPPSRDASLETLVLPSSPRDNDDDEARYLVVHPSPLASGQ